jgi:serine protease Do
MIRHMPLPVHTQRKAGARLVAPLGARSRALVVALGLLPPLICAQEFFLHEGSLERDYFKGGAEMLRVFGPLAKTTRHSVVKIDVNANTVALAAVISADGLAVTKASELKPGKLTAWIAGGKEVQAELLASDEENDVALVRIKAKGLKPIEWAADKPAVGQWAITGGIEERPMAVGIVSVLPRRIPPKRALIGVQLAVNTPGARIAQLMPGMGAEAAGLKPGDVILSVNDQIVTDGEGLINCLREFREGQSVRLRLRRDDREFEASVKLLTPKTEPGRSGFGRQNRLNRLGGEPSQRAEGFDEAIQHDTVLQPWQCGGPLLDLEGKAIGLNIARAGRTASYALPAAMLKPILDRLQAQIAPARGGGRRPGRE